MMIYALLLAALGTLPAEWAAAQGAPDHADFLGSPQPLPAVSRRARFPAPYRQRAERQHSRIGTGARTAERRPRLGPQHREPALHRSRRPHQRALHARQRQGELSDAGGSSGYRSAQRPGSGRRHLRLVVRRWRRSAAIHAGLRRADQLAGAIRPPHRRDRGRLQRIRGATAPDRRHHGARHPHRRARRQHRIGRRRSGSRDRAGGRGVLFPLLSRDRGQRSITARAAPATKADAPAGRRIPCRYGSARARCGSIQPAIARSTATRPEPRWRSPCAIRTSR